MLLVTWAASFGLDERGAPDSESVSESQSHNHITAEGSSPYYPQNSKYAPPGNRRPQWKSKCEEYLREILDLIDYYGVLRRPSLDGLRCLLLLLPLMEGATLAKLLPHQLLNVIAEGQPLERLAIYEAALSQAQAICVLSASNASNFEDAATRARLFWYAYTQEGVGTGIRGGRFVLCVSKIRVDLSLLNKITGIAKTSSLSNVHFRPPTSTWNAVFLRHHPHRWILRLIWVRTTSRSSGVSAHGTPHIKPT